MSRHKILSFVKSGIRILGYAIAAAALAKVPLLYAAFWAFIILVVSEAVGVVEEFGEK